VGALALMIVSRVERCPLTLTHAIVLRKDGEVVGVFRFRGDAEGRVAASHATQAIKRIASAQASRLGAEHDRSIVPSLPAFVGDEGREGEETSAEVLGG
jgi:hypothetical protein